MDSIRKLSDLGRITPTHRDPQRRRQTDQSFDAEFERQQEGSTEEAPTQTPPRRLQLEPPVSRRTPSEGEFHIDVLA